jgi:type 2 lantibiotic biosynthesis protein LanM
VLQLSLRDALHLRLLKPWAAPWQLALRPGERLPRGPSPASAAVDAAAGDGPLESADFDPRIAERRLRSWRTQSPFDVEGLFDRRLHAAGGSVDDLYFLLGESDASLGARVRDEEPSGVQPGPGWIAVLQDVLAEPGEPGEDRLPPGLEENPDDLLCVIMPWVAYAVAQLRAAGEAYGAGTAEADGAADAAGALAGAVDVEAFAADYVRLLAQPLRLRLMRVLAVEMRIESLEGRLSGDTPRERFRAFAAAWSTPRRRLELCGRYPVLARLLATTIRHWIDFGAEVLRHATADHRRLAEAFYGGVDPGPLCGIERETGDFHRRGRCVLIARFASGLRVVYKPKPLAADLHFQELLAWLNARGAEPPFRTMRVLDRGDYGWEEFVAAGECGTPAEVERFYRRIGGYLTLLYLIDATDVHLENLIAAGEHPMLVDLESMFHGRAQRDFPFQTGASIEHTVLRSGLLPQRREATPGAEAPDISGLGGAAGQLSAEALPHWVDVGTDGMRLARERLRMPGASNRPRLRGEEVDLLEHGPAIVRGLEETYRLLLAHRRELLAADGPLLAFANDAVRVILRPTTVYAKMLTEGFHPHVLGNALHLERHFDRLWVPAVEQPLLDALIPAEQDDLWQGDIPLFTSRPSSREVWDSRGRRIADLWDEPSLDAVLARVRKLSQDDLERQSWFVRAALATQVANAHGSRLPRYELDPRAPAVGRATLVTAALEVGARLDRLARKGDGEAGWWGLTLLVDGWSLAEVGCDLYSGLAGIALFLAQLGRMSGVERYTALAGDTLAAILRLLDREALLRQAGIGAFDGLGGAIYLLCHLAHLWQRADLLAAARRLAAVVDAGLAEDRTFDIMAGAAGAMACLLVLEEQAPGDGSLAIATRCGDHLLATAEPMAAGIGWRKRPDEPPLSGFSHGAAGIAWSLARLGAATGERRFTAAAHAALRYERTLRLSDQGTWRDLRRLAPAPGQPAVEAAPMWAWCHGAPGIGLARLLTSPWLDDPACEDEIETAIASTLDRGFGMNHSLCHGDLGNLELLLHARRRPGGERWQPPIDRHTAMAVAAIHRVGWLCGVPEGLETPGLLTGLAGIGYGLLRLADPDTIPSVLALAPPAAPASHTAKD